MVNQKISFVKLAAIIIIVAVLAIAVWYWYKRPKPILTPKDAIEAVTKPEINIKTNPVEGKVPEINPVDRANPFKDTYKNPFQ